MDYYHSIYALRQKHYRNNSSVPASCCSLENNKSPFTDNLKKIQICYKYKNCARDYFEKIFNTLCKRFESNAKIISELNFCSYLDLPLMISSKIFSSFDNNKDGFLSLNEFVTGMYNLYFGTLDVIELLVFKIFDVGNKEIFKKEDAIQILNYLNLTDFLIDNPNGKVEEMFSNIGSRNEITFQEFCFILENENSNFLFLFLIYLYKKQPFSEESLKFFNNVYKADNPTNRNILSIINNNESYKNLIFTPSKEISNLFKYIFKPLERVKRKFANKNILDFTSSKLESEFSNEFEDQSTEFTEASPEGLNNMRNLISDESQSSLSSFKDHIYKLGTLKPTFRSHIKEKDKEKLQEITSNQSLSKKLSAQSTIGKIRKSISINVKDELIKNSKFVFNEKYKYPSKCNNIKDQEGTRKLPIYRFKTLSDETPENIKMHFNSEIIKKMKEKNILPEKNEEKENCKSNNNYDNEFIMTECEGSHKVLNPKIENSNLKIVLPVVDSIFSPLITNDSLQSRITTIEEQHINFESMVYKLLPDNTLSKQKMVVVEKDLYLFRYSYTKNNFILDSIQSLSGVFITSCDETTFIEKTFYPFALLCKYGNTLAHVNNLFFFRMKKEMQMTVNYLKNLLDFKDIKHEYEIVETVSSLGRGHFGKVKLAKNKKTREKVAIKVIDKKKLNYSDFYLIRNEIDILKLLKSSPHENIIVPINFFEDKNNIYIVTEYLEGGNLSDYLINLHDVIPEKKSKIICKQIASGIKHLHKLGIVHRDIKTENILVCEENGLKIKIIDFGLSKCLCKSEKSDECLGSLIFTAPEVINRIPYDNKIDIWSYGILIYYINSGRFPYDGCDVNLEKIKGKICQDNLSFEKCKFSYELKSLIEDCVDKNASQRICIDKVLCSNWFSK
jgi:hypothetical protein